MPDNYGSVKYLYMLLMDGSVDSLHACGIECYKRHVSLGKKSSMNTLYSDSERRKRGSMECVWCVRKCEWYAVATKENGCRRSFPLKCEIRVRNQSKEGGSLLSVCNIGFHYSFSLAFREIKPISRIRLTGTTRHRGEEIECKRDWERSEVSPLIFRDLFEGGIL